MSEQSNTSGLDVDSQADPVPHASCVGRRPTSLEFRIFAVALLIIVLPLCWIATGIGSANSVSINRMTAWDCVPWFFPAAALVLGGMAWWGWIRTLRHAPRAECSEVISDVPDARSPLSPEDLAGLDVACPFCRYNLRDGTGKACPECGTALYAEAVFPSFRDMNPFPVLDPKTWSTPRRRTPGWVAVGAIAVVSAFTLPVVWSIVEPSNPAARWWHAEPPIHMSAIAAGMMMFPTGLAIYVLGSRRSPGARILRWALMTTFAIAAAAMLVAVWFAVFQL